MAFRCVVYGQLNPSEIFRDFTRYEACLDQEDAMRREKYLKSYQGRMYLAKRLKSYSTRLRD